MEILNTITEKTTSGDFIFLFVVGIMVIIIGLIAFIVGEEPIGVFPLCLGIIVIILAFSIKPNMETKHEVLIEKDHVIDATKYQIIEQRGEIYVIKEISLK